jgi:predicted GIY-YIG superfamily endonuclease
MISLYLHEHDKRRGISKTHALYRIYSADDELLYIGRSARVLGRIAEHKESKDWFIGISRVSITWLTTKEEAEAAEEYAIKTEHPLYNKALNGCDRKSRSRNKKRKHFNFSLRLADDVKKMELGQSVVVKKEEAQIAIRYMKASKGWGVRTEIENWKGPHRYANATHIRVYRTA